MDLLRHVATWLQTARYVDDVCDLSWSVEELRNKVHKLALHLRAKGVNSNDIVATHLPRSPALVLGIYAVELAGGAYLPLDVEQPLQRKEDMLKNSKAAALLVSPETNLEFEGVRIELHLMDPVVEERIETPLKTGVFEDAHPEQLAYVIYTSGSTGRPKGVAVQHKAVMNRLAWMQATYHLSEADVVMHKTPCTFDVSVWELFWPLFQAVSLSLVRPDGHADPDCLWEQIHRHQVTIAHFVPSMLRPFLALKRETTELQSLRHVFCSGEALAPDLVQKALAILPKHTQLHNLYGPTEAAIDVTFWSCSPDVLQRCPIGKPIDNMRVFILNEGQLCPPGIMGELHLVGIGLAKEYLNDQDRANRAKWRSRQYQININYD